MKFLENKIPPPVVMLFVVLLIWRTARYDHLLELPRWLAIGTAMVLLVAGLAIALSASLSFRKAQTTVNPLKPDSASELVTSGVFQYTRNPMYVGMVALACSAAVYFSSVLGLFFAALLLLYLDRLQIIPEERAMQKLFGEQYTRYQEDVRRWL